MTKRLLLLRHGKSDWQGDYGADCDRTLAKRGIKAAKTMGQLLAASGQLPDLVMTSSAVRAATTVELASQAGNWECAVQVTDALYEVAAPAVLGLIQQVPNTVTTLLLAGHEPTCSDLVCLLMGGGQVRFPTAAMARLDFDVEQWSQVAAGQGQLVWLLQPKFFQP